MVIAAHAAIDKLDIDVIADPLKVAIVPDLERIGRRASAAFIDRALIIAAARVRIDAVRLAESNVDMTAVRLPTRLTCGKVIVRIGDACVMLFAELVLR